MIIVEIRQLITRKPRSKYPYIMTQHVPIHEDNDLHTELSPGIIGFLTSHPAIQNRDEDECVTAFVNVLTTTLVTLLGTIYQNHGPSIRACLDDRVDWILAQMDINNAPITKH